MISRDSIDLEEVAGLVLDYLPSVLDNLLALGILPIYASVPLRLVNRGLRKVIENPESRQKLIKKVGARACPPKS